MNRRIFMSGTALWLAASVHGCAASGAKTRAATNPNETETTMSTSPSSETVKQFFAAFGRGDVEGIIQTFDPAATIIAVRAGRPENNEPYGSYSGHAGVRQFVANLSRTFDTQ